MQRSLAVLSGETVEPLPPTILADTQSSEQSPEQRSVQENETGGPTGPEPTRYGDWERKGRCIDF